MKVGDLVYNVWGNLLRFGTIIKKTTLDDSGWAYFQVNWYDDSKYEKAVNWRKNLWSDAPEKKINYRADEIKQIDPDRIQSVINKFKSDV